MRILLQPFRQRSQIAPDVGEICRERLQASTELVERTSAGDSVDRLAEPIRRCTTCGVDRAVDQRRQRNLPGLAMRSGVGQRIFLDCQSFVLVCTRDRRRRQFADLKSQQVYLSRPRTLVAAERRERGIDLRQSGTRGSQWLQIRRAESVECVALRGRRQQTLMRVLTVKVDGCARPVRRGWWRWRAGH